MSRRESAAYILSCAYSARASRLSEALLGAVSGKPGTAHRSRIDRLLELSDRNGRKWSGVTRVLVAESAAMEAESQAWMARQQTRCA